MSPSKERPSELLRICFYNATVTKICEKSINGRELPPNLQHPRGRERNKAANIAESSEKDKTPILAAIGRQDLACNRDTRQRPIWKLYQQKRFFFPSFRRRQKS